MSAKVAVTLTLDPYPPQLSPLSDFFKLIFSGFIAVSEEKTVGILNLVLVNLFFLLKYCLILVRSGSPYVLERMYILINSGFLKNINIWLL